MSKLPQSLANNPKLGQWLDFAAPGRVTVRIGKVEIGQGIKTALAQIAAEELDLAFAQIRMAAPATDTAPDEGVTSGSLSIQDSGSALRLVCAETRALFLAQAAQRLDAAPETLTVADGVFRAADGRRTDYWALAAAVTLDRAASGLVAPKPITAHRVVGQSQPRSDLPDKVFGLRRFIHDLDLPGMVHGRVLRPPSTGASLVSAPEAMADGIGLVRDGNFLGVVADSEQAAERAAERLASRLEWRERDALPDPALLFDWLKTAKAEMQIVAERGTPASGARTHGAEFRKPYLAHASIGPCCAIARWEDGALRVWSHTQGIFNLRADLAIALGIGRERIAIEHVEGAGCYGHNGADDVALDAALLARTMPGRPLRVQWSRRDELAAAAFGPAMAIRLEADLDAKGGVLAWRHEVWSNGHSSRPGRAETPTLLAASDLAKSFPRRLSINVAPAAGGGAERNAVPPYDLPALKVASHRVLDMPIRASALRGLGAFANVFAIESFVDELAALAGEDRLAWRLARLADPRARAVIELATARAGWSGRARRPGRGIGLGYARYKSNGAYCAVVAEVEAEREIRVERLTVAADVGLAINPDGIANQLEGGAVQAASWTLLEEVRFDRRRIAIAGWEDYPILRFPEAPAVAVHLIRPGDQPSLGAGEASLGPTAAAIANALHDALGLRVRQLPLDRARLAQAALA
ncbi:MAG: xanthine dehydrogenase family protein molybdopterin-binding subunit [Alphaproteobacteria bacterium]|nr:xanthine dehydrogenase family protein molybdopterin-binding subunit [Alphaproteobacteria bacterium]